jgi:pimeloyl-ACP methyl ester carboxylesterase
MRMKKIDIQITVKSGRGTEIPTGIIIPEHKIGQKAPLVVVCHGYMGNKDEDGYFYGGVHGGSSPGVTEQLADLGIATVRMSFPGCGDSKESFEFYNNANIISDAEKAYEHVLQNYPIDAGRIGLLGWSNGGRIGALFTEKHPEIKAMVLWAPVASNGSAMWRDIMRSAGQDFDNLYKEAQKTGKAKIVWPDGHKDYIGWEFFKQNEEVKPLDALKKYKGEALVIVPDRDEVVPAWVYKDLMDNTSLKHLTVAGADHSFGVDAKLPRLTEINLDVTTAFFYKHLSK